MRLFPIAAALLAVQLGTAQAATQTFDATQAPDASFLQLQQFNPADGLLQQVTLSLTGDLSGLIKAEAMVTGGLITLTLKTGISLGLPGDAIGTLVTVTPQTERSFTATNYDGTRDYGGTSGRTYGDLTATDTASASFTDSPMLALFTGEGSVSLPVLKTNMSSVFGPGNLRGGFTTQTAVLASVTYTFQEEAAGITLPSAPVPEPGTWALLLAGLGMVGWLSARRQS